MDLEALVQLQEPRTQVNATPLHSTHSFRVIKSWSICESSACSSLTRCCGAAPRFRCIPEVTCSAPHQHVLLELGISQMQLRSSFVVKMFLPGKIYIDHNNSALEVRSIEQQH
jgi:hypothetical protein